MKILAFFNKKRKKRISKKLEKQIVSTIGKSNFHFSNGRYLTEKILTK
jgi:hypothetical protein